MFYQLPTPHGVVKIENDQLYLINLANRTEENFDLPKDGDEELLNAIGVSFIKATLRVDSAQLPCIAVMGSAVCIEVNEVIEKEPFSQRVRYHVHVG